MDRLSSMGLSNAARKYLDAAEILRRHTEGVCMPAYFVACQGLELTLKACLRGCGRSEDELRELGHNLERIMDEASQVCPEGVIAFSATDWEVVGLINRHYTKRLLQYVISGYKQFPELMNLYCVSERVWQDTRKFCVEKQALHHGLPTTVL